MPDLHSWPLALPLSKEPPHTHTPIHPHTSRSGCLQPQYCGSCWLHGTLSMVQDRLKIVKKGLGPDVMLARQSMLNCAAFHE